MKSRTFWFCVDVSFKFVTILIQLKKVNHMVVFIKEVLMKGELLNEGQELTYKENSYININLISLVRPSKNPEILKAFVGTQIVFILKKDFEKVASITIDSLSKVKEDYSI